MVRVPWTRAAVNNATFERLKSDPFLYNRDANRRETEQKYDDEV